MKHFNNFDKLFKDFAFYSVFFAVVFFTQSFVINAATRTWDGGGADNNWSTAANWSADTIPTSADEVVFDATATKNATVDTALTVNSVSINSGYSGTITQTAVLTVNNTFTQSAGTFQGTPANANFGYLLLNTGSIFNAPTGTLSLNSQVSYYVFTFNGGTFNANGGTINANGRTDLNYFSGAATPIFNNLTITQTVTILNPAITVNGNLTLNAPLSNSQVTIGGNLSFASNYTSGSALLNFVGTTARTVTIDGNIVGNPILINNPNLTLTTSATSGTVTWNQKVTLQAGTLNQSAANYIFSVAGNFNVPGFEVKGGTFNGSSGNAIFNTTIGISSGSLNGGTGDLGTNIANCPAFPQANYYFQQSGGTFSGGAGNAKFCDLRRTVGAFTAPSGNLTIVNYGDFTGGTFDANNGTLIVSGGVTIIAPGLALNNVTLQGASGHSFGGTPKPIINGTFDLAEGTFSGGDVAVNGDLIYGANFTGGGGRLFFEGTTTRTINLPARNILLGMTLDNPNITVTTSGAGASSFTGEVEVRRGRFEQGAAVLNLAPHIFRVSGGTFTGSAAALNISSINVSGGTFSGGSGLISGGFGAGITQSGGTFSTGGDVEITGFTLSGGTFNAPSGTMTVIADWTHTAGGTFNGGTGTVKFTGYNTFNCINQIIINVNVTETFNNLIIANQFCNARSISTGDTLIVNGDFRIAYGSIGGGRIRPLGTTTIEATNNGYVGGSIVEYLAPNTNFVINNPASVVNMFPVEMNAANSTLTSSGAGRINFVGMNLINGTVNQGAGIWDITNPGYSQSSGTFNGSAAELFVSNGTGNPLLTGGVFNSGTGKVTGSFRITGGTMSIQGDMDTANLSIEGGIFNAPLGTLSIFQGFSHTLGGTFNARTGTVKTSTAAGVFGVFFDVNATETFNNLQFNGTNNNANHVINTNDTFIVNGTLNFNGRGVSGGSIVANGDVSYTNLGGYQNATTLVKFQDTATRTITFSNNCTSYFQPTLVDNPNITINTGCNDANANLIWTSLDLRQGIVNNGNARSGFTGSFTQSGGTFNAGNNAINPSTTIAGNFTLSGGDFNAAPFTNIGGNYTHILGGNFNYGTGTVIFGGLGGTIDVNTNENFNHVRFEQGSTGTTKTIASGDTLIANGDLNFRVGYVSGGAIDAKKNVSVVPNFSGGNTNLIYSGTADQNFTNTGGITTNGSWTVNKPNSLSSVENSFAPAAPTNLLISGNIGNNSSATLVPLDIVSGNVVQTGNYSHGLASLSLAPQTSFVNEFAGVITLGGNVSNDGIIKLNANGAGCQTDAIALRSTNATQRSWNGNGFFLMTDVDVSGQSGTPIITVYNGTNSGNNGANWVFDARCFAPSASNVSISGKVLTAVGNGIANVRVILTDSNGLSRVAVTNSFGNYQFEEVAAGQTVTVSVNSKKFIFTNSTQVLNVSESLNEVNFTAEER